MYKFLIFCVPSLAFSFFFFFFFYDDDDDVVVVVVVVGVNSVSHYVALTG